MSCFETATVRRRRRLDGHRGDPHPPGAGHPFDPSLFRSSVHRKAESVIQSAHRCATYSVAASTCCPLALGPKRVVKILKPLTHFSAKREIPTFLPTEGYLLERIDPAGLDATVPQGAPVFFARKELTGW